MKPPHSSFKAKQIPVSVKGIVSFQGKYLLRKNERNEWELLGGKLEAKELPLACVVRELREEAGLNVNPIGLIDTWIYHLDQERRVLILTYVCTAKEVLFSLTSPEGSELAWFTMSEIAVLNMPEGYKRSIMLHKEMFVF